LKGTYFHKFLELEVITYGGIVTRLLAPDRNGQPADVVLGFKDLDSYLMDHPYLGAITGRVAGRITGASCCLEGKTYQLVSNDAPNHLHGGIQGFDKHIWKAEPVDAPNGAVAVRLTYESPDGEEGYPGTVNIAVTYTVTSDNCFLIDTEATTDMPTPFNLTHHSYFNLAGESAGSVADHEIQVCADYSLAVDEHMTLLGRIESVAGRDNDFRRPQMLGTAIPRLYQNHGDLYLISRQVPDGAGNGLISAARLAHPKSGRVLEVSTTETHIQFYTGALLAGSHRGKSGASYSRFSGVCL
jgi:aldose 1-epimerase